MTPKKSKKLSIHFNFFDVIKGLKVITDLLGKFISALSKILYGVNLACILFLLINVHSRKFEKRKKSFMISNH